MLFGRLDGRVEIRGAAHQIVAVEFQQMDVGRLAFQITRGGAHYSAVDQIGVGRPLGSFAKRRQHLETIVAHSSPVPSHPIGPRSRLPRRRRPSFPRRCGQLPHRHHRRTGKTALLERIVAAAAREPADDPIRTARLGRHRRAERIHHIRSAHRTCGTLHAAALEELLLHHVAFMRKIEQNQEFFARDRGAMSASGARSLDDAPRSAFPAPRVA